MTIARVPLAAALLGAAALQGCGEKKPMLTLDVLTRTADKCGASELQFTRPADPSAAPSFSYLDPGPLVDGKATPVSTCLADALSGHRFASMKMRFEPPVRVGPSGK